MKNDQAVNPSGNGPLDLWGQFSKNFRGMLLMGVSAAVLSISHTLVRGLSAEIHPMQIGLFRTVIPLFLLIPMLIHQGKQNGELWWRSSQPGLQLVRGVFGGLAMMTWFYALSRIPVGDATALSFTVVIFTTVGAALIFREQVGVHRWSAVAIGIIGTMVILRPGIETISLGAIVAIISSFFWAAALLSVKVLSRSDSPTTIVFYSSLTFTAITAGPAVYYWSWPTWEQLVLLCLVGLLAFTAQMCVTTAIREAETTAVMPIDFTRLIWASALGYLWFGEFPDTWTWVGGFVVFISTVYITYRESRTNTPDISSGP